MVRDRVRSFFEAQLPAMIGSNPGIHGVARGSIAFVIHGAGDWLLRFGQHDDPVTEEVCFDADLTLMFTPETFAALLDGVAPVDGHGFGYDGDPKLLAILAKLLSPPLAGGVMGARAAAL